MKIIESTWRNGMGYFIGFVLIKNEHEEVSCRIGAIPTDEAISENSDGMKIAKHGGRMPKKEALALFPEHSELINTKWKQNG